MENTLSDIERNKQVVVDYYQTAFGGNPEKAIADHFGPVYVQHNPDAQDGPEAFIGFVNWLRGEYPDLRLDINGSSRKATSSSRIPTSTSNPVTPTTPAARWPTTSAWRTEKVVEHWDVIQDVPTQAANDNGVF